jgi:hypothetical protein
MPFGDVGVLDLGWYVFVDFIFIFSRVEQLGFEKCLYYFPCRKLRGTHLRNTQAPNDININTF